MRADHLLPHGWLRTYRWALENYDLVPFWYQTAWINIPTEAGSQGFATVQLGDDFWFYQLGVGCQAQVNDEQQPPVPIAQPKIPGIEIRMRIDGDPVFGDFTPASLFIGGALASGLGPGWILRRGSSITIEWNRPIVAASETQAESIQFVMHGCQLARRGAATYDRNRWRNMLLGDFDKRARLRPMVYTAKGQLSSFSPSQVTLEQRIRDRHFILRSIRPFAYSEEDGAPVGPYNLLGGVASMRLFDQGGSWHDQGQNGISAMGMCGDPLVAPYDLRIPRIIPAERTVTCIVESFLWNQLEEEVDLEVGVQMTGYELIADRRGKPPKPGIREQIPFRDRPGAR